MAVLVTDRRTFVADRLLARNSISRRFFDRHANPLACACQEMAGRFLRGGRLLAFGQDAAATDAQHVSVEFVHPVIVGKRALPAIDLSATFARSVPALVRDMDIVLGFSGPEGDTAVAAALAAAGARGAQTFALPALAGRPGGTSSRTATPVRFEIDPPTSDAFICQELVEILYHTLWETVHVFFEHQVRRPFQNLSVAPRQIEGQRFENVTDHASRLESRHAHDAASTSKDEHEHDDLGASAFLYPFLGGAGQDTSTIVGQVAASIRAKAADDERLRMQVAEDQSGHVAAAAAAVLRNIQDGATLFMFGNGGSATDANDWAIDCVSPPDGGAAIPAVSLSAEPANITAIANDIGREAMFLRQLIAHGRRGDVAIAISTSGGSSNLIAALEEARKRGMLTMALLGYDGGEIARRGLADLPIVVQCDYIPRIQEVQASIYHVMTEAWRQWRI